MAVIISTKFEADMAIHCQLIAFLMTIRYVTLTFDLLALNSCHTWRVMWSTLSPSLKYEFLPCAKSHDLLLVGDLNVLSQSYSSTSTYRIALQKLNIWSHLQPFSATFLYAYTKNGYLWTSGINSDTTVRFPDPNFLTKCEISAIWRLR